jgi:hypothetical protein
MCGYVRVWRVPGEGITPIQQQEVRSNAIRHTVDALALRGDEGRGKLRKAWGSCTRTVISGCPNGETRPDASLVIRKEANAGN